MCIISVSSHPYRITLLWGDTSTHHAPELLNAFSYCLHLKFDFVWDGDPWIMGTLLVRECPAVQFCVSSDCTRLKPLPSAGNSKTDLIIKCQLLLGRCQTEGWNKKCESGVIDRILAGHVCVFSHSPSSVFYTPRYWFGYRAASRSFLSSSGLKSFWSDVADMEAH